MQEKFKKLLSLAFDFGSYACWIGSTHEMITAYSSKMPLNPSQPVPLLEDAGLLTYQTLETANDIKGNFHPESLIGKAWDIVKKGGAAAVFLSAAAYESINSQISRHYPNIPSHYPNISSYSNWFVMGGTLLQGIKFATLYLIANSEEKKETEN